MKEENASRRKEFSRFFLDLAKLSFVGMIVKQFLPERELNPMIITIGSIGVLLFSFIAWKLLGREGG